MSSKLPRQSIASVARRIVGQATTMLAALVVSGCALINTVPPTVRVIDVQLTGLGLLDQQLATTLCVTNPNSTALSFRRINVAVEFSGLPFAEGASDHAVFLPPKASTVVPFSVTSTARYLGAQLLGTVSNGSLNYRVHGSITLDGPIGLTVPFSRSGQVDPLAGGFALMDAVTDPNVSTCTPLSR